VNFSTRLTGGSQPYQSIYKGLYQWAFSYFSFMALWPFKEGCSSARWSGF
jgi:hypothetical protein